MTVKKKFQSLEYRWCCNCLEGSPTPVESGGIPMLISRHLNPPPLSRVLVTIGNYNKHPLFRAFAGNLPETTPKMPPFLRKWKHACDPLMNSSEGGGGGGGRRISSGIHVLIVQSVVTWRVTQTPETAFSIISWSFFTILWLLTWLHPKGKISKKNTFAVLSWIWSCGHNL